MGRQLNNPQPTAHKWSVAATGDEQDRPVTSSRSPRLASGCCPTDQEGRCLRRSNSQLVWSLLGSVLGSGLCGSGWSQLGSTTSGSTMSVRWMTPLENARLIGPADYDCFWCGCPEHYREPTANKSYWSAKLQRNLARDAHVNVVLQDAGWTVLRVWEHELPEDAATRVAEVVRRRPN